MGITNLNLRLSAERNGQNVYQGRYLCKGEIEQPCTGDKQGTGRGGQELTAYLANLHFIEILKSGNKRDTLM